MPPVDANSRLDRHALVLAVWLAAGFVAAALFHYGFAGGGAWWVLGGFGAFLAGFAGHVVANAVLGTDFTAREVALGLVLLALGLLADGLSVLAVEGFAARFFLPVTAGLAGLVAAVAFYMLTRYGVRSAFEKFDVIRDFNPRPASRLPHRGGRR